MRIRNIQIDEFGLWRNLRLELDPQQLTVLYGPNETGKSTLLRFIRGVLYGFHPDDSSGTGARPVPLACGGCIDVAHGASQMTVRRTSAPGTRGQLTVLGIPDADEAGLRELLQVGEGMFRGVFAIGLEELQRLATLRDGEVGEFIYQTTLGPRGERLVAACRIGEHACQALVAADGRSGRIRDLLAKITAIDAAIADHGDPLEQYAEIEEEHRTVEQEIADQRRRIDGLNEQLRGHALLQRVWRPWQRQRQLQSEFDALAEYEAVPEDGLSRLDQWERDEVDLVRNGRRLKRERRRLQDELRRITSETRFAEHAEAIRDVIEDWDELALHDDELTGSRDEAERRQQAVEVAMRQLGSSWTPQRLRALKTTPDAAAGLLNAAAAYRSGATRRNRYLQRYQTLNSRTQQEQVALNQQLGGDTDTARRQSAERIAILEELRETHNQAVVAQRTIAALEEQSVEDAESREFPPYFLMALTVFGIGGVVLCVLGVIGFFQGWNSVTPMLIGAIFTLLGICCAGVSVTMKRQFNPGARERDGLEQRLVEAREHGRELQERLQELRETLGDEDDLPELEDAAASTAIDRCLHQARERVIELDRAIERRDELAERRRRLSGMRERIRELQRHVGHARREWCAAVEDVGLDESLRVADVLGIWARAAACRVTLDAADNAAQAVTWRQQRLDRFWGRVARIAEAIGDSLDDVDRGALLESWRQRLAHVEEASVRRGELRTQLKAMRRELAETVTRLNDLRGRRQSLLAAGGAHDVAEFRERHAQFLRRRQLADQIEAARADLESAASEDSDLAVVEEDLIQFDEDENGRAIETIESELEDLEEDARASHEQLGRIHRRLEDAASDSHLLDLRFERAQLMEELEQAVGQLESTRLAVAVLEELREDLERRSQPRTLQDATDYLMQLTAGRYVRVWTSLGERRLVVDEASGRALLVEQLSNGTREQLYLAIRLALIEQLRGEGVQLPLILDDVLVNFDEARTSAAVDTLQDIAASGQQVVVFTCHRHLAREFQLRGAALIDLPGHDIAALDRRVG